MNRLVGVLVLIAATAQGQGPSADWRTIRTPHFRVHYPAQYEAWSRRAASRLESIRESVARQAGFDPPNTIDVIVSNPIAQPNGVAWPILDRPRILFFTEPPGPEDEVGTYGDWIDLLAVHEVTHIVHMLRPSRNPLQRVVEKFILPISPIMRSAPRWVLEGYATVVEGRLTGAGRPSSTVRAAILRKWAANGRLPPYSKLNSDSRFLGLSMAYLAGSAYLEWLEKRTGPDSLRHLWSRMTARDRRSFNDAFRGVFGEKPERLYGIFTAELTASAVALTRTELREGELWQETSRGSGDPAASPDGSKIAVVLRERRKPPKLVIWSTGPPVEEEKKYEERQARILERDPQDVRAVRSKPLERKPLHSFTAPDGGDIETPRWTADGGAILFARRMPDREGFLHCDLFLWKPQTGQVQRLTNLADVSDADPRPDGKSAVAVRNRFGFSQLVSVDLASGEVKDMTAPSLERVYTHPRVKGDGSAVAYVVNQDGTWTLEPIGVRGASSPEWRGDDLFATISMRGFAEIHRIQPDGSHTPITRSSGAAFDPAPAPDGRVFFMGLEPDGFVVRVTNADAQAPPQPEFDPTVVAAVPARFAPAPVADGRDYGIGRQEVSMLFGQIYAPGQRATEVGVRVGDVVGRLDTLVIGSFGSESAERGAAIAGAWRGWPVAVSAHGFKAKDRNGVELRTSWKGRWPRSALALDAGALAGQPFDLGFFAANIRTWQRTGSWEIEERVRAAGESGTLGHARGVGEVSVRRRGTRLAIAYQRDAMRDGSIEVGGLPSSIVPDSAFANRVYEPALPVATLAGKWHEGRRVEATYSGLAFFVQEHRTDLDRRRIAGVQVTLTSDPTPILRLAGFDLTLGAARQVGRPAERDVKWWFGLRWTP